MKNSIFKFVFFFSFLLLTQSVFGQTKKVCSLVNIPKGWVVVNIQQCNCCGAEMTYKKTQYTIKKISEMQIGTKVKICSKKNIPQGWVVVNTEQCGCCGAEMTYKETRWTIERIE